MFPIRLFADFSIASSPRHLSPPATHHCCRRFFSRWRGCACARRRTWTSTGTAAAPRRGRWRRWWPSEFRCACCCSLSSFAREIQSSSTGCRQVHIGDTQNRHMQFKFIGYSRQTQYAHTCVHGLERGCTGAGLSRIRVRFLPLAVMTRHTCHLSSPVVLPWSVQPVPSSWSRSLR